MRLKRTESLVTRSFKVSLVLLRRYGDAGAVHEDDLPDAGLFLQEGRFQPVLVHGAGSVGDAAFIDVGDPSGVAVDVNLRFGHVPFIALARGMLCLDEGHDGVSVESGASIKYVKAWGNDRVELRNVVCAGRGEYCAHCVDDLLLVGGDALLLSSRGSDIWRKD
jgi:hypothetical protein